MSDTPPSRAEFDRIVDIIREDLDKGFLGVTSRLDVMNGTQRSHGERLSVLEAAKGRVSIELILALLGIGVALFAAVKG